MIAGKSFATIPRPARRPHGERGCQSRPRDAEEAVSRQVFGHPLGCPSDLPRRPRHPDPWDTDRRVFSPVDRISCAWEREYAHRTAVERVHRRLDVAFDFELHTIRGLAKMRARCGLALLVMLGMALGRIRQQHPELLRSLVRSA
jgi:hypothetical protein